MATAQQWPPDAANFGVWLADSAELHSLHDKYEEAKREAAEELYEFIESVSCAVVA